MEYKFSIKLFCQSWQTIGKIKQKYCFSNMMEIGKGVSHLPEKKNKELTHGKNVCLANVFLKTELINLQIQETRPFVFY